MYGSDVTAVIVSSIPNLATEHQHNSGLGAVHGSGSTQTSPTAAEADSARSHQYPQLEQRNCRNFFLVTNPIAPPPIPATHIRCTQQRTQAAATNNVMLTFISSFRALQRTAAWPPFPIPTTSVKSARDVDCVTSSPTPAPTTAHAILSLSYSALQRTAWPSLTVPTTPVKPARDVNALTLTGSEAARNAPHYSTRVPNPPVDLRLQTPMPLSHRWSSASNPVPAAASQFYPQAFDISDPHIPFHDSAIIASSSGRSHTAAHQHNSTPTFELPTPSPTPFSNTQYRQRALPTARTHPAPPHLGIFAQFPSPHPMPHEERHNFLDFSLH
ncbi:hypothetical protein EDB85DRAFT_2155193 [Lactarius pseudohatsudake]|nr:hypothetical protein EDB85DRAFT_2155193 [Lactarius pseudohatsudake]